ncbi:hypothetical protein ABZX92_28015 [Lentzea sp. NPDC006480]|uniref:hypothetical protein n=1 Tax=Lentzea sp. NPDC006480 TaxID=3157176 RepID=UPI0033BD1037
MSVLIEVIGGVAAGILGPTGDDHTLGDGDVFINGRWQEGELCFGPSRIVWDKRIVFSPAQGRVEMITHHDSPYKSFRVLHFRRADDVVLLAVHHRELKRVATILPLPL